MKTDDICNGLKQLGFDTGWVVRGQEIELWENPEPQPTMEAISEAAKNYVVPEATIAHKLASVGLTIDDLKIALGL